MFDVAVEQALGVPCRIVPVEVEAFAAANLVSKSEEKHLGIEALHTNLKSFPYRKFRGCFDIVTAGFPCQPFSGAGKRAGVTDERHLWPYIADGISEVEPPIVFLENVTGIITSRCADGTPVLLYVLRDLEQRGYKATWGVYSAAEVGAPHLRKRVFIAAVENAQLDRWRRRTHGADGGKERPLQTERPGELADSGGSQHGQDTRGNEEETGVQGVNREALCRGGLAGAGEQLADAEEQRVQGLRPAGQRQSEAYVGQALPLCGSPAARAERTARWVARPGEPQFDWEEPRTIESKMDCTANGMACVVDSLRLTGNGVVWQCAAKACRAFLEETLLT